MFFHEEKLSFHVKEKEQQKIKIFKKYTGIPAKIVLF